MLHAMIRVAKSLAIGITRLEQVQAGGLFNKQIVYAIVKMFSGLLEQFGELASCETQIELDFADENFIMSTPKQDFGIKTQLSRYTVFLCTVIDGLHSVKWNAATSDDVFEGLYFYILSRLGKLLYTLNFSKPRPDTIAQEILAGRFELRSGGSVPDSTALQRAALEAPYMIHVLKHCRAMRSAGLIRQSSLNLCAKPGDDLSYDDGNLCIANIAKERLQNTLINAIFGTEALKDNDSSRNCLSMPVNPNQQIQVPAIRGLDIAKWCNEAVWKHLGWDMLSK